MNSITNIEIVQTMYGAFKEGDLNRALSMVDPQVEWIERFPYEGTFIGRDALRTVFETVISEFDRYDMEFHHFLESDNLVVVLGRYRVHKIGAPRDVESSFVHAFWLRDGSVTRYEQWLDTALARDVIGHLTL